LQGEPGGVKTLLLIGKYFPGIGRGLVCLFEAERGSLPTAQRVILPTCGRSPVFWRNFRNAQWIIDARNNPVAFG